MLVSPIMILLILFLLDFVHKYIDTNVKELHVFSDGCPAQNKNHTIVRMWLSVVQWSDINVISQMNHYIYKKENDGVVIGKTYIDGLETHTFWLLTSSQFPQYPSEKSYQMDVSPST